MPSKKKPMTLNRETIKQLDDSSLGGVAGGARPNPITVSKKYCKKTAKSAWKAAENAAHAVVISAHFGCKSGTFKTTCW
jgi:hypothetical protein